jgi:hypothetical protein
VTQSDFIDWKRHPVTQQVFSQLQSRIAGLKDELVGHALSGEGETAAAKAGAILALEDILSIDFEESHGN